MNKLLAYLNQPYPSYEGKRWPIVLIPSVLVFFILFLIQPFGTSAIPVYGGYYISPYVGLLGFAVVTAICMVFILYGLRFLLKKWYEHWTFGKNILYALLILVIISMGNVLYDYFIFYPTREVNDVQVLFNLVKDYLFVTILVGFIPTLFVFIYQKNHYLAENLEKAQEMNHSLINRKVEKENEFTSDPLLLSGNTKDSIELYPEELLFIEAYGNYIKVNYLHKGVARQKLLRATIKQIEDELSSFPNIIRCHRAFIVNTAHIKMVKGNTQGCRLILSGIEEEVPVSRAYARPLKEKLEQRD